MFQITIEWYWTLKAICGMAGYVGSLNAPVIWAPFGANNPMYLWQIYETNHLGQITANRQADLYCLSCEDMKWANTHRCLGNGDSLGDDDVFRSNRRNMWREGARGCWTFERGNHEVGGRHIEHIGRLMDIVQQHWRQGEWRCVKVTQVKRISFVFGSGVTLST